MTTREVEEMVQDEVERLLRKGTADELKVVAEGLGLGDLSNNSKTAILRRIQETFDENDEGSGSKFEMFQGLIVPTAMQEILTKILGKIWIYFWTEFLRTG